jgi:predicted lipoprotein
MLATAILASASAGRADEPDPAALKAIVARAVGAYAVPASAAFADQAKRLAADTRAGCRDGQPPADSLRTAFRDLAAAWGRLAVARFGPLATESRLEKLAFWPDERGVIRRQTMQLAAAVPAGDAEASAWLAKQSAAVQGLPAFDLLVFSERTPKSCRMALAIATNVERLAHEVAAGFADGAQLALLSPSPQNPLYLNEREAAGELVRSLRTQADVLRTIIILPPLGEWPDEAKPSRLFLRFTPATKPYLIGAIEGLEQLLKAMALEGVIAGDARANLDTAHRELQTAREMLAGVPMDPVAAITDPQARAKLTAAGQTLEEFNRAVGGQLAPALGLRMGFDALDGD